MAAIERPLVKVLEAAECPRDQFNNFRRRGHLTVALSERPRVMITREGALEIAFLAVLGECGVPPRLAAYFVSEWLQRERAGQLWETVAISLDTGKVSSVHPEDRIETLFEMTRTPAAGWTGDVKNKQSLRGRRSSAVAVVDLAEKVRRIDALFDEATPQ